MGAIIVLLEYLPMLLVAVAFVIFAIPMGFTTIAGIFGAAAVVAPNDVAEGKGWGVLFKLSLRMGLLVLAIIFGLIALDSQTSQKKVPSANLPNGNIGLVQPPSNNRESARTERSPTAEELAGYTIGLILRKVFLE